MVVDPGHRDEAGDAPSLAMPITPVEFRRLPVRPSPMGVAEQTLGRMVFRRLIRLHVGANGNNGSAFAGLTASTWSYDTTIGAAMLIGRFFRSFRCWRSPASARRGTTPVTVATFPTYAALLLPGHWGRTDVGRPDVLPRLWR